MPAAALRRLRVRRMLAREPAGSEARALAVLAELGSSAPKEELAALATWFQAADPRALRTQVRAPALLAEVGFGGQVVIDEPLGAQLAAHRFDPFDGRFRPRRDAIVAARIAELPAEARASAIERLLREPGPRESALHLALLQAAEAASPFAPSLPEQLVGEIAGRLMALFVEKTANPILERAAPLLGRWAHLPGLFEELRSRLARAAELVAAPEQLVPKRSFLEEVQGIERGTITRDEAYYRALPWRQLRNAAAEAVGRAAAERDETAGWAKALGELPGFTDDDELIGSYLEGVAGADEPRGLAAMVASMLGDEERELRGIGLGIVAVHPLDDAAVAEAVAAALGDRDAAVRAAAVAAAEALDLPSEKLLPLVGDEAAEVGRRAAQALARRGVAPGEPAGAEAALAQAAAGGGGDEAADALYATLRESDGEGADDAVEALGGWLRNAPGGAAWLRARLAEEDAHLAALASALAPGDDTVAPLRLSDGDAAAVAEALRPRFAAGGETAFAAALLAVALLAGRAEVVDWLEQAWGLGDLPADLSLAASLYGQLRVRDPRAAARVGEGHETADLAAVMLAVLALAATVTDGDRALVARIEEAATLGSYGATTAYTALAVIARDLPALLS